MKSWPRDVKATITCPFCLAKGRKDLIEISEDEVSIRCHNCQRRLLVLTRKISEIDVRKREDGWLDYFLVTEEHYGKRARRIVAPPGPRVRPGQWVTLVSRGQHLLGIANQSTGVWYPISPKKREKGWQESLLLWLTPIILVLLAIQGIHLTVNSINLWQEFGLKVIAGIFIIAFLLAQPLLIYLFELARGPDGGRRRVMPKFDD